MRHSTTGGADGADQPDSDPPVGAGPAPEYGGASAPESGTPAPDGAAPTPGQAPDHLPGHGHGHGHGHGESADPVVNASRRTAMTMLLVVILPLAAATLLGVILLWPHGDTPANSALDVTYNQPGEERLAVITKVETTPCPTGGGANDPATQSGPGAMPKRDLTCVKLAAKLKDGPRAGKMIAIDQPPESHRSGVTAGDEIKVMEIKAGPGSGGTPTYAFIDFERKLPIGILAAMYAVAVVAVARMRGLRALIGLGVAYAVLGVFMLPGLLEGESPLMVGLVGSSAIMFVVLYLAHGLSARTSTALIGTLFGLAVTAILGAWATRSAHLTGMNSEDNFILLQATDNVNLSQIVLCGLIIAGLGVLNDVTITQASAVWEMYELQPSMSARRLFTGAMRIGRDHIASTVYTIAFAYAGAALPILMLLMVYERPMLTSLTSGELAEEVVRTLVGSVGLVLAIPITTLVAVVVVKSVGSRSLQKAREARETRYDDERQPVTVSAADADAAGYSAIPAAGATPYESRRGSDRPAPRRGGGRRKR